MAAGFSVENALVAAGLKVTEYELAARKAADLFWVKARANIKILFLFFTANKFLAHYVAK